MANYPYTVPAEKAFMGKARTYSAKTQFRQYAVRLRALVDNPRDPAEAGAIGADWAVDEPGQIVEEGSNANGSYQILASGLAVMRGQWSWSGSADTRILYPLRAAVINVSLSFSAIATSASSTGSLGIRRSVCYLEGQDISVPGATNGSNVSWYAEIIVH